MGKKLCKKMNKEELIKKIYDYNLLITLMLVLFGFNFFVLLTEVLL